MKETPGRFRVNYAGSGQISRDYPTAEQALRHIEEQFDGGAGCYVQQYMGDGEWARWKPKNPRT